MHLTKLTVAAFFGAVILLIMGVSEVKNVLLYSHPTVLTYDQFVQQRPDSGSFTITGGTLNPLSAAEDDYEGPQEKYFIALMGPKDDPTRSLVQVVVASDDPTIYAAIAKASTLPRKASTAQIRQFFVRRNVTGMVKIGTISKYDEDGQLSRKMGGGLTESFLIVEEGQHPSLGIGLLELFGSVVCLGMGLLLGTISGVLPPCWWQFNRRDQIVIEGAYHQPSPPPTSTTGQSGVPWWEQSSVDPPTRPGPKE